MAGPLTELAQNVAGAATDSGFWGDVANNAASFMRPDDTPTTSGLPAPAQMGSMPWKALYDLRNKPGLSQTDQNYLAPYEHQAYAREYTHTPYDALQQAVLSLGYTPYKQLISPGRSQPSAHEIGRGLLGAWEGMTK